VPDTIARQRPQPLPERTLILDGRFRLKKLLGEGGMGLVYLAEQVSLGRACAVKVLREDLSLQAGMGERFRREALLLSSVDHASVVRVIDFGMHGASACLVMEYADGETLEAALRTEQFPPERCLRLLIQLAQGLAAIHEKGIVHRDLKPENVMLTRVPGGEQARLLDFGIARIAQPDAAAPGTGNVTQVGLVLGTPEYLSPEQALGQPLDARSDIYAFGILAFRMLSGALPFDGPDLQRFVMQHAAKPPKQLLEVAPQLFPHSALATLVMSCLEKRPEARPQTAVALANELARFSVTMPDATAPLLLTASTTSAGFQPVDPAWAPTATSSITRAATPSSIYPLRRRARWKLYLTSALLAVVALAVTAALIWYSPSRRARRLIAVGRGSEALQVIDDATPKPPATDVGLSMLKAAALHQVNRHDEELELMKAVPPGTPLEPQAIEALADDFGRREGNKDVVEVRKVLLGFPKAQTLPVLQELAVGPPEGSMAAAQAAMRASTAWAQWGSLRFVDLEYAGQGLPLVDLYVKNVFSTDCRVRALAAGRLGELRSPAGLEALKRLKDSSKKGEADCGHVAAAAAVKTLEKDLNP
jgi:serine/threonine protein kinase